MQHSLLLELGITVYGVWGNWSFILAIRKKERKKERRKERKKEVGSGLGTALRLYGSQHPKTRHILVSEYNTQTNDPSCVKHDA